MNNKHTFSSGPKVSVIITTLNSAKTMVALLRSIKNQVYKNIEIIVVDNFSVDQTVEISKRYTTKVFQLGPERSTQRNEGAKKAKGEFLFFLDSDMVLQREVINDCVKTYLFSDHKIGGFIVPEKSYGEGFWAKTKAFEREINRGMEYFEAARFFPKKIFNQFKGYDINLTGPEDWDLPSRIKKKYPIERINSFILHNEGRPTLYRLAKRKYYYGLSVDKYLKKQQLPVISPVTVYFLRPAFYKHWLVLLQNPVLTLGMMTMLFAEMCGGVLGYCVGKIKYGE